MAPTDGREALWFAFRGGSLLVRGEGGADGVEVPRVAGPEELGLETVFVRDVGELDGTRCYAVDVGPEAEAPEGMAFRDLRRLAPAVGEGFFRVAGRAVQVVEWNRTHRFCGRCGAETVPVPSELAKRCPRCGMVFFPRLSPAAIVLVRRGEEVLLARSPGFPKGMYSVLAGFVEAGESIEETIGREVREEVGVEVGNVRYFGSQPWPFPNSLMIGFTADFAGGELRAEPAEIEDAGWFGVDDLPPVPPRVSIARAMIDAFVSDLGRDPKALKTPG